MPTEFPPTWWSARSDRTAYSTTRSRTTRTYCLCKLCARRHATACICLNAGTFGLGWKPPRHCVDWFGRTGTVEVLIKADFYGRCAAFQMCGLSDCADIGFRRGGYYPQAEARKAAPAVIAWPGASQKFRYPTRVRKSFPADIKKQVLWTPLSTGRCTASGSNSYLAA